MKSILTGLGSLNLSLRCLREQFIKFTVTLTELCGPHLTTALFRGTSESSKDLFLAINQVNHLTNAVRRLTSCLLTVFVATLGTTSLQREAYGDFLSDFNHY